jgi:transposase
MRSATPALQITDGQREVLERLARSRTAKHREVQRARALLLAGDGEPNTAIGARVGVSPTTVKAWRERFADEGLKGLGGVRPGRGRKPQISQEKVAAIVHATLHETPPGETHWSCRSMAKAQGSVPRRSSGSGRRVASSRTGSRRSSSQTTSSSRTSSSTSSACIWTRPRRPWCCVWTKRARSRRLIARSRRCR